MLLGIDVGGTFTDAVLVDNGAVHAQAKRPTTHGEVLRGILAALDAVMDGADAAKIERVVISSTIVTNALTEGKTQPVFLAVMTGPGMNVKGCFPVEPYLVSGYVDHRGKIAARTEFNKHYGLLDKPSGVQAAAVSGKFAVRNPENEYVLEVTCSKGTYIRTLLEDIADALGQKGTMSALRRTCAGLYTEADAHTLEEIQAAKDAGPEALQALMLPVESVFASLPLLVADERVEQHLYNGCPTSRYPAADGRYRVRNAGGQFLGLANVVNGVLKVEKLFVERN